MTTQRRIFITGTDTDVGKTLVTVSLITKIQQADRSVIAVKPLAAGCETIDDARRNSDALLIQEAMQKQLDYQKINPIALKQPIAPHLAATNEGKELSVETLSKACNLNQHQCDYLLVEGAGGWMVPLNDTQTLADFAIAEQFEVILVVGMKLGCINHALLTAKAIQADGLKLIGWVANSVSSEMRELEANIETLKKAIDAPLIAQIPYIEAKERINSATSYVKLSALN